MSRVVRSTIAALGVLLAVSAVAVAANFGTDVRLSRDDPADPGGGYKSDYTLVTGQPYSDATLDECTRSRGRQNEPASRSTRATRNVIVGSSNDYCGVYNRTVDGVPQPVGPIWLGYYRSQNGGSSFQSLARPRLSRRHVAVRGARADPHGDSGDPVLAWDKHGRLFAGAEAREDPAGTPKGFGDVWVATLREPGGSARQHAQRRQGVQALGDRRQGLLGAGHSAASSTTRRRSRPTAPAARCEGNVYFAWSRFNGNGGNINFSRSTDHGADFSQAGQASARAPTRVQFPDIAVTGNGHVYVTFRHLAAPRRTSPTRWSSRSRRTAARPSHRRRPSARSPRMTRATWRPGGGHRRRAARPGRAEDEEATGGGAARLRRLRRRTAQSATCSSGATRRSARRPTRRTPAARTCTSSTTRRSPARRRRRGRRTARSRTGTGSQSGVYFVRYDGATGGRRRPS